MRLLASSFTLCSNDPLLGQVEDGPEPRTSTTAEIGWSWTISAALDAMDSPFNMFARMTLAATGINIMFVRSAVLASGAAFRVGCQGIAGVAYTTEALAYFAGRAAMALDALAI